MAQEGIPRVENLIGMIKRGEISIPSVMNNIASVVGRFRIDATGIEVFNRFKIGASEFGSISEALYILLDILPLLMGKVLYINLRGLSAFRIRVGLPLDVSPATASQLETTGLPVIDLDLDRIPLLFQGQEGMILTLLGPDKLLKIHNFDVLLDWLAETWQGEFKVIDMVIPLVALTRKEAAQRLNEPLTSLRDEVLARCGA